MKKREYIITDGDRYIMQDSSGKYKLTSSNILAEVYDEPKIAEAVLNNAVPKTQRTNLFVGYYENGMLNQYSLSEKERKDRKTRITSKNSEEDKSFGLTQYSFDDDPGIKDLTNGFMSVKDSLEKCIGLHRKLEEELIRLDYMNEDIKHYKGRKRLNARDGYKLYNAEQEIFLRRVSIKNQMEIAKKLEKYRSSILESISDICDTIEKLQNQTYKPRILVDLFENDNVSISITSIK